MLCCSSRILSWPSIDQVCFLFSLKWSVYCESHLEIGLLAVTVFAGVGPKVPSSGAPELAKAWAREVFPPGFGHMAVFQVEPLLAAMANETSVSIKARVLLRKPGITVCQSVIHQQIFSTTIGLDFQAGEFSILDGVLKHINNHLWLEQGSQTEVISRPPPNLSIPLKAIEICSGIGAGATGLQACGISTQVFNDMNPKYCAWLERKAEISQKVVQGDINSSSVIRDIADAAAHAQLLSAGISCQPFSSLGDRREQHDDRSKSFTGTLRASHHLGPAWILLECTKEARFSQWAQTVLSDFCKQTG